jgi:hypothetical protein
MNRCKFALAVAAGVLGLFAIDAELQKGSAAEQSFLAPAQWLGIDFTGQRGWHKERHPRMLVDINGDKRQDLVGFGHDGVYIAFSTGTGFSSAQFALAGFGYNQGWRVDKHVRVLADINNDGRPDIVGFGDDGVWTALSTGSGFAQPRFVLADAGYNQGWMIDQHVRVLADVNNDGCDDIVAFGYDGVWLSLADCSGAFGALTFVIENFGAKQGWDTLMHLRLVDDINGDGRADIVAFGYDGVWTALSTGSGFAQPVFALANFGASQGWDVRRNPRQLADVDRDGKKDIIGFGYAGLYTARSTGNGGFGPAQYVFGEFGTDRWSGALRMIIDLNADGYLDIVGIGFGFVPPDVFGRPHVWRSLGGPTGFTPPRAVLTDFPELSETFAFGDVDNDGRPDLVDFDYYDRFHGRSYTAVARSSDLPPPLPPAAPSNVQLTNPTPTTLMAAWQNNSSETRFFLLSHGQPPHLTNYSQTQLTHSNLTGLAPDKQYCLTVSALSWFGVSNPSPEGCARTLQQPTTPWVDLLPYTSYLHPTFPEPGETATITWDECVLGTKAPGAYNVKVFHDRAEIYSVRRPSGLSLGCYNFEGASTVAGAAGTDHVLEIVVDTDNEVAEATEANNRVTYTYHPF